MTKKDKWYVPDEFKNIKDKGVTQIVIGIVIAVCGAFSPSQGVLFVLGGVIWAFVGVCLVIAKYIDEQDDYEKDETSSNELNDKPHNKK